MTYGPSLGLFAGSGPTLTAVPSHPVRSSARSYVAWRGLDEDRRLALVEEALAVAANDDHPDGFPAAL